MHGQTKTLHQQVILQSLTYSDCGPEALLGTYDHKKDNSFSFIHPVLALLFLPRIKFIDHSLEFQYEFSEFKLKFAIIKAAIQFRIKKYLGDIGYKIFGKPFKLITDKIFKAL